MDPSNFWYRINLSWDKKVTNHSYCLSIDQKKYRHFQKKFLYSKEKDLLQILEKETRFPKFYWRSKDRKREFGCVGKMVEFFHIPKFDPENESPARIFGGQAFSKSKKALSIWVNFPRSYFFIPFMELEKKEQGIEITINQLDQSYEGSDFFSFKKVDRSFSKGFLTLPNQEQWTSKLLFFQKKMKNKELEKIVLSRKVKIEQCKVSPFFLLKSLKIQSKNSTVFAFFYNEDASFIGATPERLYFRKNRKITVDAVAGTRPVGNSPSEKTRLQNELMNSEKEKREFAYVKNHLFSLLTSLCKPNSIEQREGTITTSDVQHLQTILSGTLPSKVSDQELISILHPTPATAGFPINVALQQLGKKEGYDRGWYAGPIGWFQDNSAEIAVAIRSAFVTKKEVDLFSGVGIISESDYHLEWKELNDKIQTFIKILT
ncbi:MAG: isochorismate synthase [Chlamydiae bacterium]|nr:isochorismate synthase [Chlamydiota bacterium]